ncbi:iron chaperone [Lacticaseibacillus parakribbianus]|uniref:iron chaperone n=1 Tax=Lacticaseibacillus parakribbianus TaxID=2970927 RepID=UPI0021CB2B28
MSVITDYLRDLPAAQRPQTQALYELLQRLLPAAVETFSYGMPALRQPGGPVLVYFGAFKGWVGFYPTSAPLSALASELVGFSHSKGALQLPYDRPLPETLIAKLVAVRLAALN